MLLKNCVLGRINKKENEHGRHSCERMGEVDRCATCHKARNRLVGSSIHCFDCQFLIHTPEKVVV